MIKLTPTSVSMSVRMCLRVFALAAIAVLVSAGCNGTGVNDPDGPRPGDEFLSRFNTRAEQFTVQFNTNGGVPAVIPNVQVDSGRSIGATRFPADPTREERTFDGWFDGSVQYTASMIITKNVTLTARWLGGGAEERTQFTVSFNTNGGAPTVIPDVTVDSGFPLDTRFPTNPTRQGTVDEYHTFEGWFDGEEQYTASTRITKNVTLTARWTTHERGTFDVEMVFVQGGTFRMGCTIEQLDECWDYEKPAHNVNLSGFYIGKYPVTQRLWKQVMNGDDPSSFKGDDLPVETVSWDDVQVFITNLNNLTQRQYRLPTEAEWEYAARGGRESRGYKYAGSDDIDEVAWYDENSGWTTQPVGTKAPNELGIYDMSGNVWEWVNDWWGEYPEADSRTDPRGPSSGSGRVVRGGSWDSGARICRVSYRSTDAPDSRSYNIGFRLALSPP